MKRLAILTISLFLLLGQWGSLEHLYHDHSSNESCDYCLQVKSLDQLHTSAEHIIHLATGYQVLLQPVLRFIPALSSHHTAIRAPPEFI